MRSERVFQILLVLGLAAGGWLYGEYLKKTEELPEKAEDAPQLRAQNAELVQEIDRLEDEVAQLRSLMANGPYPVPDDLIAWVEMEHNMVFRKTPEVRLASPTDFRKTAHDNLRLIYGEPHLEHESLAWELLGLLPPDQRLLTQLLFVSSSGIKGVFDMTSGQVLLSQEFDPLSVPDRSVLVRLLAQQLSFQNHPRKEWSTRDEWQAWEAIHVGAAADLQARFLKRNAVANEAGWTNPEPQREALLNDLAPALQGFCNFPFLEGAIFAHTRYLDSRKAWTEMFQTPPLTTNLILHPDQDPRPATRITWDDHHGEAFFKNNLGELGLRLWLEPFIGNDQADQFASTWEDDAYQLIREGRSHALIWRIRLANEEIAGKLATEIERSIFPILRETQPIRHFSLSRSQGLITLSNFPENE